MRNLATCNACIYWTPTHIDDRGLCCLHPSVVPREGNWPSCESGVPSAVEERVDDASDND